MDRGETCSHSAELRQRPGKAKTEIVETVRRFEPEAVGGARVLRYEVPRATAKHAHRAVTLPFAAINRGAVVVEAELIATANVTAQGGSYFLALSVQNIFDNKVEYSKTLTCKNCDAVDVVDKLKELVSTPAAPVAIQPAQPPEPQLKLNPSDPETALWEEVKTGNPAEDYQAYISQYPKGKFVALAKTKLTRLTEEAKAEADKQEQQAWETAHQNNTQDSYTGYLDTYPKGSASSARLYHCFAL